MRGIGRLRRVRERSAKSAGTVHIMFRTLKLWGGAGANKGGAGKKKRPAGQAQHSNLRLSARMNSKRQAVPGNPQGKRRCDEGG